MIWRGALKEDAQMIRVAVACLLLIVLPAVVTSSEGVAQRLAALKIKSGTSDWDKEVKKLMLATFDKDGSGMLEKADEIQAIPCEVWRTLAQRISTDWGGALSLISSYGFRPDRRYVGEALGIKETMRNTAFESAKNCGLN
jgi:hypothetical protein